MLESVELSTTTTGIPLAVSALSVRSEVFSRTFPQLQSVQMVTSSAMLTNFAILVDVEHVLCMTLKCHLHEVHEALPQSQTETFTSGIQEVEFVNAYYDLRAVRAEV